MKFPSLLQRGRLLRRYKRFLADVRLDDGTELTAACPNTGSMLGLCEPGCRIWLSRSDSLSRKYPHRHLRDPKTGLLYVGAVFQNNRWEIQPQLAADQLNLKR